MIVALFLAAATPSPEALALGRQLAETGTLAAMLPLIQTKETEELVAANSGLPAADKAALRATASAVYRKGRERLMDATGRAYAERLSIDELRTLVAFQRTPAAVKLRAVTPEAIAATMQAVGPMEFKKDVLAAFCTDTGKLCPAK